jgi:putative MATE family efflux protein
MQIREETTLNEKRLFRKNLRTIITPLACQNLLFSVVSASDAVMVGMLSQTALSAVSLASQIQFLLSLFYAALTIGTTIIAAQYWGKGDKEAVTHILSRVTVLSGAISFVFFLFSFFTPALLMRLFTSDQQLITPGALYLHTVSWSYLAAGISQIYLCIMKNTGRAAASTVISIVTVIINIIANMVFIFGLFGFPHGGIGGAAVATVLARVIELTLVLIENSKSTEIKLRFSSLFLRNTSSAHHRLFKDFITYTTPVLANELVWGGGFTMFSVIIGHLGSDAVAANAYAMMIKNLVTSIGMGTATGSGIVIGNELGRGELERAKRDGDRFCRFAIFSGIAAGCIILGVRPLILQFSTRLSPLAHQYLSIMLCICAYYVAGKSYNATTVAGIFCAGGDSRFGLRCDTLTLWCIIIPCGALAAFVFKLPVLWVYFILNLDEIIKLPVVYRHYKKLYWLKNITR